MLFERIIAPGQYYNKCLSKYLILGYLNDPMTFIRNLSSQERSRQSAFPKRRILMVNTH